jgi:hypothetical protein
VVCEAIFGVNMIDHLKDFVDDEILRIHSIGLRTWFWDWFLTLLVWFVLFLVLLGTFCSLTARSCSCPAACCAGQVARPCPAAPPITSGPSPTPRS